MYFKKLLQPELFQGRKKKNAYFEGWYYKLVSQDENMTIALIPGVSIQKKDPHAFIQVFMSQKEDQALTLKTYYVRYDIKDFSYEDQPFSVRIKDNIFSKTMISIDIRQEGLSLKGKVHIRETTPLKKSLWMPNIMGPFGYLNFMECYHGVVSMNHTLHGTLQVNGSPVIFNDSKGYIEKDWGKSFPRAYVWLQSNHFKEKDTSLMFSYADIPFLGFYFKGLIAVLSYQGKELRFATYNRAKIKKEDIKDRSVHYVLKKGSYILEIEASSDNEISLASPKNGEMINQIKEGLSGNIDIKLYKKNTLIYQDTGYHAGIEIMKKKAS